LTGLFFVFAFRYTVPDRYAFFIPFYVTAAILIGLGAHFMLDRMHHKVPTFLILFFCLWPIGVYAASPTVAGKMQLNIGTRDDIPYREDNTYFLQPWKTGYNAAECFADEALDLVADNAIIYADATTVGPLLLARHVKGKRPDVAIISGTVNSKDAPSFNAQTMDTLLENRTIYTVSRKPGYCPDFVLEHYDLVQVGILWKVVARKQ
jgi:hypothetical protein